MQQDHEEHRDDGQQPGEAAPSDAQLVRRESTALSPSYGPYYAALPLTNKLAVTDRAAVDASEGIHSTAARKANEDENKSLYEVILLVAAILCCALVLFFAFPWEHFLKPSPQDIVLGPTMEMITDADVEKLGGIEKLSPVQLAIHEITGLREAGRLHAARDKCNDYLGKIQNASEHAVWLPVWRHYLEVLDRLQLHDELTQACTRLETLSPDAVEATYFRSKLDVDAFPLQAKYKKEDVERLTPGVNKTIQACEVALNKLSERKNDTDADVMANGFHLLLAQSHLALWRLSEYSWDDTHREAAFAELQRLPEDSADAIKLRLTLYRECRDRWRKWWRNDPEKRVIDGRSITFANLTQLIEGIE